MVAIYKAGPPPPGQHPSRLSCLCRSPGNRPTPDSKLRLWKVLSSAAIIIWPNQNLKIGIFLLLLSPLSSCHPLLMMGWEGKGRRGEGGGGQVEMLTRVCISDRCLLNGCKKSLQASSLSSFYHHCMRFEKVLNGCVCACSKNDVRDACSTTDIFNG